MVASTQLDMLKAGAKAWNSWRRTQNEPIVLFGLKAEGADFSGYDFRDADLRTATLDLVNFSNANLTGARLSQASLTEADLTNANVSDAYLSGALFTAAKLDQANFSRSLMDAVEFYSATLSETNLGDTDLTLARFRSSLLNKTNFAGSSLDRTLFAEVDLSGAIGLAECVHNGPSIVDHITLQKSTKLPKKFLYGIGLQTEIMEILPRLRASPEYYSCFISYSHKDDKFARRIHGDLTKAGIHCWFAPHDLPIGAKFLDEIDSAIRLREKLLLILSESSIASDWVEDEVTKAFEEERLQKRTKLFPIRLDDHVLHSIEPWAVKLRNRHIGDFRKWDSRIRYQEQFQRILRDLRRSESDFLG